MYCDYFTLHEQQCYQIASSTAVEGKFPILTAYNLIFFGNQCLNACGRWHCFWAGINTEGKKVIFDCEEMSLMFNFSLASLF